MPAPTDFQDGIDSGVYKELIHKQGGERKGGTDDRGRWQSMQFWIPFEYKELFQDQILASSTISGGADGDWVRKTPFPHPDNPNIYAQTVDWEPEGAPILDTWPLQYTTARMTVMFRPPQLSFGGFDDPEGLNSFAETEAEREALLWATSEIEHSAEWIPIPNTAIKFLSDNVKINSPMTKRMTTITMSITWDKYPVLPMGRISAFADKINLNRFLGKEPFTVMFMGCKTGRQQMTNGQIVQKVQMTFKWRPVSWNRRYRPDKLVWDLVGDSDGNLLHEAADFAPILLAAAAGGGF